MSFVTAYFDEQRREQAEAGVSCSLPSFLWTSIRKNGRRKGEIDRSKTHIGQAKKSNSPTRRKATLQQRTTFYRNHTTSRQNTQ
jgi:hypothetical protein